MVRLKVVIAQVFTPGLSGFQFPNGSIKREGLLMVTLVRAGFNSLMVRLKAVLREWSLLRVRFVSIP